MGRKKCSSCKRTLLLTDFYNNRTTKDGLCCQCKECGRKKLKKRRFKATLKKECSKCKRILLLINFRNSKTSPSGLVYNCKDCEKESMIKRNKKRKERHRLMKITIVHHYSNGTMKCVRCGWSDIRALSLDHINNDGAEDRKKYGHTNYSWIISANFPKGYQILCRNCNYIKYLETLENKLD